MTMQALSGCADRDLWPAERLDSKTAVNVTIMAEPWVYSRDVPMLAANARDYLNLGVVETNRAGNRAYWLGVISWSTIDRSILPQVARASRPARVRLLWPHARLELPPASNGRSAVGLTEPVFEGPQASVAEAWCPLSAAQLAQLGKGAPVAVALVDDAGESTTYGEWQVHAAALAEFLKATGF